MNGEPTAKFQGKHRIHIGLAVTSLAQSRKFYETLFGVTPTKVRPGYVKFEPENPSVNLSLSEIANKAGVSAPNTTANHYGVQVKSTHVVQEAISRFAAAGLPTQTEESTTCCYAVQDKAWATDPDGNRWEVFVVLEDAEQEGDSDSTCCDEECCADASITPPTRDCCADDCCTDSSQPQTHGNKT